jgi:hypothetical protein
MGLKLMAELGLDGTGFQSGFNSAKGLAHGFAGGLRSVILQGVGIATVEQAIAKTVQTANELYEASERLGIAPKNLQVLRQAAKESNVEFENLVETFEKIDVARQKALGGGKEGQKAARAFLAAGINFPMLHSKTASDLFEGPLSQMVKNRNPEEIGIIFRQMGLKDFGKMIPILKTNFQELAAKMEGMGAIMDNKTIVTIKRVSQEMSLLSQIMVSQLGPALVKLAEAIYENALKLGKGVTGAGAFFGAGLSSFGATATKEKDSVAGALLKTAGYGAADIFARVFMGRTAAQSKAYLESKLLGMGFDLKGARAAAAKAEEESPFTKRLKEFQALMDKFSKTATELDNPKPHDFSSATIRRGLGKRELESPTDSLVRIGNFLGSGRNAFAETAKQTQYLAEIAKNTRHRKERFEHALRMLGGVPTNFPAI